MRVLHVVHRVVVVLGHGQIDIKGVFGIGLAAEQEKPDCVGAGPLDQIAQGHITARSLGNLHLLTTAHHPHHGVQHVVGVSHWNTQPLLRGSRL